MLGYRLENVYIRMCLLERIKAKTRSELKFIERQLVKQKHQTKRIELGIIWRQNSYLL